MVCLLAELILSISLFCLLFVRHQNVLPCTSVSCQAIICGRVGRAPEQKILPNGRTLTTFTVGTGGMYDQRLVGANDLPKPAQWHQITVHNKVLGGYAVDQFVKK